MNIGKLTTICISVNNIKGIRFLKMTALLIILCLSPILASSPTRSLQSVNQPPDSSFRLLPSGYGPEDLVLDSIHNPPRLLVSCSSRRQEYPRYGEIESINPVQGTRAVMARTGEPAGLVFRPHGISLTIAGEIQYLYVISHDDDNGVHPVIRYQIDGDTLVFVELLDSRLLVSPNALHAFPDGSFLVCNDAGKRNSMKEKIFRQKLGNILFYDGRGNWSIVARDLGMPCGLTAMGSTIFVSATLENKLYSFRFTDDHLDEKAEVCKITGPDNIRVHRGRLIITSHTKPLRFIRHVKSKTSLSPSLVVSVNITNGNIQRLFFDRGNRVSAASVALILNNQLIIGQIFEPGIGITDLKK